MVAVLPLLYSVWATRRYVHEPLAALRRDRAEIEPLRVRGGLNALGLALVVLAVGVLPPPGAGVAVLRTAKATAEIPSQSKIPYPPLALQKKTHTPNLTG